MKLSTQIKSISYLKTNAAAIAKNAKKSREPLIITQNGEAKLVIQSVEQYEQTQETLALLKLLALGDRQIENGQTVPFTEAMKRIARKQKALR